MRVNEVKFNTGLPVDGYGAGFFRINGERFEGAIAMWGDTVHAWGGYEDVETLSAAAAELDVLFVGTGAEMEYLPSAFTEAMTEAGVAIEPMTSPTACRTYNVLLSEGRRVGLAVLPV